ncbi:MAG: ClpXP protease specificity-enhancing factor SspB, partial [Steroidobacteraceae bacterium]|nr:ClpXP protease specificity-enhancing factor SspB [Steroidobacteraceae bacterium]MDW8258863.1 ClpXP protease specificity-enhancing factor SspB [Gammaproteobacteria bacterium]
CGLTPHVIVDASLESVEVPRAYVKNGKIVLNISSNATQRLEIGNEWLSCDARFSGVVQRVRVPVAAVLGIYARETGEGLAFAADEAPPPPGGSGEDGSAKRPQLRVVK